MGSIIRNKPREVLTVPVTQEQLRALVRAAEQEHISIGDYVLHAALRCAQPNGDLRLAQISPEEVAAVVTSVQAQVRKYVPAGVSLVEELIAERRLEALREVE